jgi:hypothetical protein
VPASTRSCRKIAVPISALVHSRLIVLRANFGKRAAGHGQTIVREWSDCF